jgi:hypothetical protein
MIAIGRVYNYVIYNLLSISQELILVNLGRHQSYLYPEPQPRKNFFHQDLFHLLDHSIPKPLFLTSLIPPCRMRSAISLYPYLKRPVHKDQLAFIQISPVQYLTGLK